MICKVCGMEGSDSEYCEDCGYPLDEERHYCPSCGIEMKQNNEWCTSCGTILTGGEKVKYAGFWIRFVAILIDGIVVFIPLVLLLVVLMSLSSMNGPDEDGIIGVIWYFGSILAILLYFVLMQSSRWQATVGKRSVGIQVTTTKGGRVSFLRSLGRYLASILSGFFYIGYILAGITPRKQALHDFMAGTVVIHGSPEKKISESKNFMTIE